jgi:hypothetical protein
MATDHVPISGEYCTFWLEGVAVAATRTFNMNVDRASYGTFVARGTSKWRTNYVADIGGTFDVDGLIVVQDTSPTEKQFDDLFTYMGAGTRVTIIFTLRTNTSGEKTFIYTAEAYITSLTASAPQFGEATWSCSLIVSGAIAQTTGTVS